MPVTSLTENDGSDQPVLATMSGVIGECDTGIHLRDNRGGSAARIGSRIEPHVWRYAVSQR